MRFDSDTPAPFPRPAPVSDIATPSSLIDEPPRKKVKTDHLPSGQMAAEARSAVLAIESKIFTSRAFFKELESRASGMVAVIDAQSDELEKIKGILEMD